MQDEIDVLRQLTELLDDLPPDGVSRVLSWANNKYNVRDSEHQPQTPAVFKSVTKPATIDLADYFDESKATTNAERALVVGSWLQLSQNADFDSAAVNRELKNLGYPSGNITRDFDDLMSRQPKLVVQTKKAGSTKQARKMYRVTREGSLEIEKMRGRHS